MTTAVTVVAVVGLIVLPGTTSRPDQTLQAGLAPNQIALFRSPSPGPQPSRSEAATGTAEPAGPEVPPGDGATDTTTTASSTSSSATSVTSSSTSQPASTTGSTASTVSASTPTTEPTTTAPTTSTTTPTTSTSEPPGTTSTTAGGPTTITESGACFQPGFRDDFDGTTLSGGWYHYETPGSHSPHARRHRDAVSVGGGLLEITATNDDDGVLMSGGIGRRTGQTYGRFSARVRTEKDPTEATSGVILTWPMSNDQPRDGENNMYETLWAPGDRSRFFSYIHEPFDNHADGVSQTKFIYEADASQWQVVTMEWTPDFVSITREGPGAVARETRRVDETSADLIPDMPHFLAVQLDQFKPSLPDGASVTMQVDWVETWTYCG